MSERTAFRRGSIVLLSLLMTVFTQAFAEERTTMDPRLVTPGKLTVGTGDPVYPPWMLNNDPANEQVDVFQAMRAGQIDGTLISLPTALYVTAVQVPEANIVALLPPDENDRGHGLLFEYNNPLIPWVDDALTAVIDRGVVEDLKAEYLIADPDLPIITE